MDELQTTEVEAGPTSEAMTVLLLMMIMMKMAIYKLMLILKISHFPKL
jgi:hypothetical protein